jgi:hypothetical protein
MTHQTQARLEALILLALRDLQGQDPEIVSHKLDAFYDVAIDPQAIFCEIEDLAEAINSSDRELFAV